MTVGVGVREWGLAVDFGTTATAGVMVSAGEVSPLALDGAGRMSSSVYARPDGVLEVGRQADHEAAYALERYRPTPKRDVAKPTVRLGDRPYTPVEMISAIMGRVLAEALHQHDGVAPHWLVLTHPVAWSATQREVLAEAMRLAARQLRVSVPEPIFVAEPVAAAQWYSRDSHHDPPQPGELVAVYDLGGGTFDAAVLRRTEQSFTVLGRGGIDGLGGYDFDYRLFTFLGESYLRPVDPDYWQAMQLPAPKNPDVCDKQRRMRTTVQLLKEGLSTYTSRSTNLPGAEGPVLVTRDELEGLVAADIDRTIEEFLSTLDDCDIATTDLTAIYRVGGASRMPLVGQRLQALANGVPVRTIDDPKLVVALGASITERSAVITESDAVQDDVRGERSRLLWHTAQATEERGDTEAAADHYRKIAELGHPDWRSRARAAFQALGQALARQADRQALRTALTRSTGALRSARAAVSATVSTAVSSRELGRKPTQPSVAGTTWQFVDSEATVDFLPGGGLRFSDRPDGGRWHQNGSRLTFDSSNYYVFTMVIDGDEMSGTWRPIRSPGGTVTNPAALQRISGGLAVEERP